MATISFDFDGTLSRSDVQDFAIEMKKAGHRTMIITNRHEDSDNKFVYEVAKKVGIKDHHVWFCNMIGKHRFIRPGMKIDIHLDDDWIDCELVEQECGVPCVKMFGNPNWKEEVYKILNHK